ncbi:glycosyl transferase family 4-domain-containing protein [Hyaloraphidium curvatum]|nr:glycosyl transferase family 4-domain-containing protein [Hyaloraphidium curvatum]
MPNLASSLPVPISVAIAVTALFHSPVLVSFAVSVLAAYATHRIIPLAAPIFIQAGQSGKDVQKNDKPVRAESMGVVAGAVYFVAMFLFIPVPFAQWFGVRLRDEEGEKLNALETGDGIILAGDFPLDKLASFLSGLLALQSMLFLGFADDVFDIRWRVKIWFPVFASIPLLTVYYVTYGVTDIKVPLPLRGLLGTDLVDLGFLYYCYMVALCVFCTNAVNILAGINGIEGGQSLVIALSILANDLYQMATTGQHNPATMQAHLMSLYFILPFIGVTVGYLWHNWFPAAVFGGDTYAYFAGMTFAVVGILSHISKTILLFHIPQIFNFLYSCPQVFGFVHCPRHRMPKLNPKTGLLEPSYACLDGSEEGTKKIKGLGRLFLNILRILGLADIRKDPKTGDWTHVNNLTLINLVLVKLGPLSEERTTIAVMVLQAVGTCIAAFIRYGLVSLVY